MDVTARQTPPQAEPAAGPGSGVAVAYRTDGDALVVLRLTDAPWVGQ